MAIEFFSKIVNLLDLLLARLHSAVQFPNVSTETILINEDFFASKRPYLG